MVVVAGNVKTSWNPEITADTITSSYWLTWKVFGCAAWLMVSTLFATFLISRYERGQTSFRGDGRGPGVVYEDEVWRPCLKGMHPVWLLGYRVVSFFLLLVLLIINGILDGGSTFFYYTQWIFTLVTIYFGAPHLGSVLSMYGCYAQHNKVVGGRADSEMADAGQRSAAYPPQGRNGAKDDLNLSAAYPPQGPNHLSDQRRCGGANRWHHLVCDCSFPFDNQKLRSQFFNIIFLLGDTALNSLQFPWWFGIAYFMLWTISYVSFQWVLHACFFIGWAVPILGLVNFTCSSLVRYSRNNACPMLRRVHSSDKDEERSLVEILPRVFPGLEVIQPRRTSTTVLVYTRNSIFLAEFRKGITSARVVGDP